MALQPIVDLQQQCIIGFEALARGVQGQGAHFVLQQITPETADKFEMATRAAAIAFAPQLRRDQGLWINFLISSKHDAASAAVQTLLSARSSGISPNRITLEILETQVAAEDQLLEIVSQYRRHGFRIAIDDFGIGNSCLHRLIVTRPDVIKIDRLLTADCHKNNLKLEVIAGMVRICSNVGIKVVAEGIELLSEVMSLRAVGVRFMQGFYFAPPTIGRLANAETVTWP